jgi:uncharacterized membrane protein YeaQ/YmgE (transglycosylase-associated protein family)
MLGALLPQTTPVRICPGLAQACGPAAEVSKAITLQPDQVSFALGEHYAKRYSFARNHTEIAHMTLAPMSLLGWLIIGAIAGWLAGVIVSGYGFGLIGIVGALIGGLVFPSLGIFPVSPTGDLVAATVGAVILLVLLGLLRRT